MPFKELREREPARLTPGPDVSNLPRRDLFGRLAAHVTRFTGGRWGFMSAFAVILIWAVIGPFCHYSDSWQLVINTGTTIVTFLMVFLIQNAQNRESKAVHLKLDELILAARRARNELIDVELLTDEQLDRLAERYRRISQAAHRHLDDEEFLDPVAMSGEEPDARPEVSGRSH